jgi:hypothetical protein
MSGPGASVLLTEPAKNALPGGFETSSISVGEVDGFPTFVGLQGWGYALSRSDLRRTRGVSVKKIVAEGWMREYLALHPADAGNLAAVGICNESTYLSRERDLPSWLRQKLGLARLGYVVQADTQDPCEIAKGAPPWLLVKAFRELSVTMRVVNALSADNINTVQDLLSVDLARLLQIPKFGRGSRLDLMQALRKALAEGPKIVTELDNVGPELGLDQGLLSAKERDVLSRRTRCRRRQTLQQIADEYGVTRERIRQIEAGAVRKLNRVFLASGHKHAERA